MKKFKELLPQTQVVTESAELQLYQSIAADLMISEATYKGKEVALNKPMPGDVKKRKVYVDPDGDGKATKVEFGDTTGLTIKTSDPDRRRNFRARHNCDTPGPKDKARYWSCKAWSAPTVKQGLNTEGTSYNKPDEQTGVMSYHDLEAHIGKPKALLIAKHQQFQKHMYPQMSLGAQVGFKFERRHGFEHVYAVHGPNKHVDKEKPGYRTMLRFHLSGSGKKVTQVDRSVNHNNERHREGSLVWDHRETWEHPTDKRENKRLAKSRGVNEEVLSELNIPETLQFIKNAHGEQLYGKLPYWTHPRAVAMTGKRIFGAKFNSDAVKVAFLHDVVEDTNIGLDQLRKMDFSAEVIQAVGLLTKDKALTYFENIHRIIKSGNKLAQMVKYADNYENFHGDKSDWDPARASSSQKKYLKSLNLLGDKLGVSHHIDENFKDGKGPGQPGDSVRHGIPKNASLAELEKIRSEADPKSRKWVLAHWQLNMRRGQVGKTDK